MAVRHEAEAQRPTVSELLTRLRQDSVTYAKAEFAVVRAQAAEKASGVGVIAGLAVGAIMLTQAAIVALLVGLLFAIAISLGFIWATVIVVLATFAVIGILGALAFSRYKKLTEK